MTRSDCDWRTIPLLLAFALAGSVLPSNAEAEPSAGTTDQGHALSGLSPQAGEAWVVSTRCVSASCPTGVEPAQFSYRVSRTTCSEWEQADAETFFASTVSQAPVIVFIHGNRTDSCEAIREGVARVSTIACRVRGAVFSICYLVVAYGEGPQRTSQGRPGQGCTERYAEFLSCCVARPFAARGSGDADWLQFRCARDRRSASFVGGRHSSGPGTRDGDGRSRPTSPASHAHRGGPRLRVVASRESQRPGGSGHRANADHAERLRSGIASLSSDASM